MRCRDIERGDRHDPFAVPETVEHVGGLPRDRSDAQDVKVAKVELGRKTEVLVADVAPADHRPVVGDEQLVVHTVVEPFHAIEHLDHATRQRSRSPSIEQPNLDVRVAID